MCWQENNHLKQGWTAPAMYKVSSDGAKYTHRGGFTVAHMSPCAGPVLVHRRFVVAVHTLLHA